MPITLTGGLNSPEPPPPDSSPSVSVDHRQLPVQVRDAYLLFQVILFLFYSLILILVSIYM